MGLGHDAATRRIAGWIQLVGLVMFLAVGVTWTQAAASADESAVTPVNLRCEYRTNPLGIDVAAPRFSWQIQDSTRGARQTAYELVVSTDQSFANEEKAAWATGKMSSDQSVQVAYAGKPLTSSTRYFWRVRTWDAAGKAGKWSEPAWFETALLSPGDWRAEWITAAQPAQDPSEPVLEGARWIWNAKATGNNKDAWFRRSFSTQGRSVERAEIRITADNSFALHVNGNMVGGGDNFNNIYQYNVTNIIQQAAEGKNVIAIKAWNGDGPAGLLVSLRVVFTGGETLEIKSDGQWKTSHAEVANWNQPVMDDSGWDAARVEAPYGEGAWGQVKPKVGPRRSICVRNEFKAKDKPARARAYVTGLGAYKLYLNDKPVSQDILSPGWTDYRYRVQYQTYDVTDLLQAGTNGVGAMLGNGWWSGGVGWHGTAAYSSGNLRFLMQLLIEYPDGSQDLVVTDKNWRTHTSPVTRDTPYHGESHDARLEMPGWASGGFDQGQWSPVVLVPEAEQKAALVADKCEPIRVTAELKPAWISEPEKGVYIVDFGQNASGYVRIKVRGATAGQQIRLRFGEELDPNGKLYRDNYRSAEATDYFTCKGSGEEIWEPLFTYRGMRFCEVTGYPGGRPPEDALLFRVFHTDAQRSGVFECSHPLLTQLFKNIMWGQRSNLHSIPTDCPQRDERLGWTGDANVFGPTSCWNMDMAAFYHKWMRDVMDSQSPEGWVTDVAPAMVVAGPAAPGWGDACVVTPHTVWQFYGDTRIIEESFDAMVKWIEYMHANRNPESGLYEREGFGDWVAMVESPKAPIGAAYYYYSTKLVADMARAIGRNEEAEKYSKRAEEIAAAFNKKWLDAETNQYPGETQTANLLPLHFGMVPADRKTAVANNIVENIRKRDYHLSTGFLGTAYLMNTLADFDQQDTAYKLATQTTCPSWLYMLLNGATTTWERWDTDKWDAGMNSRNHYAFGAVGRWMMEDLAGINIDAGQPGFKHIIIRPQPAGDLTWASASYASMYGDIRSEWHRSGDGITLDVTIPANTTATVYVPTLGQSSYRLLEDKACIRAAHKGAKPLFGPSIKRRPGITQVSEEGKFVKCEVGAGKYRFSLMTE